MTVSAEAQKEAAKAHNHNQEYWNDEHTRTVEQAVSYDELTAVALDILERMPKPIGQVCGPISNGGVGSIEGNLQVFQRTVAQLIAEGKNLFDQVPFEKHIFRIAENSWGEGQNTVLLEAFYRPIFESGHVKNLYFIHDWQSSDGAQWEHEQAERLDIEIIYLEKNYGT